jgi:DNA replication protein DnaC
LRIARADESYPLEITRMKKTDLFILDDFGLQTFDAQTRMIILEIIEDRYDKKSTIIGSQLPFDKWYDLIGEGTIADAILDRLYHGSHRIDLKGESMRKKTKKE